MKLHILITTLATMLLSSQVASAQLKVDFNSLTQDGGPHPEPGFESYDAGHEVASDFVPMIYSADFGSGAVNVTVNPQWPNTTDNRVMQSIDRSPGFDVNWVGNNIDLLTDWIGADSRTANGGNGDWFLTSGTPTYLTLTLSGLPMGTYEWLSYHHDTENIWSDFQVEVSTDGGLTFGPAAFKEMTSSSPGGTPPDPFKETGSPDPDPMNLSSTFTTTIDADGVSDVVLRFAPFHGGVDPVGVHKQFFGMNAFELSGTIGTNYCISPPNSTGFPALISGSGSTSVSANDLTLVSGPQPVPDQPGLFFFGPNQTQIPFGNGFRCIASPVVRINPPVPSSGGTATRVVDLPTFGISVGTQNFQYWYLDPAAGGALLNLSDGLNIIFTP